MRFAFAALALLFAAPLSASVPTKTFDNAELKYSVALPVPCRHVQGPGTLEAVCSGDLDAERSKDIAAAGAILLEVDAEQAPADAPAYSETAFRSELPESICGESDPARVQVANVKELREGARTVWTADVTCAPVPFLQLAERRAEARTVIDRVYRYRLMARWTLDDAPRAQPIAQNFFASFKATGSD
jgi:hypothetical protein